LLTGAGYADSKVNYSELSTWAEDVDTNTIERIWSLSKSGIRGDCHSVSSKHLQGYLNEYAWRYSHRGDERSMTEMLLLRSATLS
jgi:hypothetical protein